MNAEYSDQSDGEPTQGRTGHNSEQDSLTVDERFEILKNARRRIVLEFLSDAGESVKLGELADHVTAVENDTEIDAITSSERKRVYVGLYQFHLPKMSRMGVIQYDQDRGDVALTETGKQLYREHESDSETRQPWWPAYLAVGLSGLLALCIVALTQSWLVAIGLLGLQTGLLLSLSLYHRTQFRADSASETH